MILSMDVSSYCPWWKNLWDKGTLWMNRIITCYLIATCLLNHWARDFIQSEAKNRESIQSIQESLGLYGVQSRHGNQKLHKVSTILCVLIILLKKRVSHNRKRNHSNRPSHSTCTPKPRQRSEKCHVRCWCTLHGPSFCPCCHVGRGDLPLGPYTVRCPS